MINIEKILDNKAQFLALTSLHLEEFESLLAPFQTRWYQYHKHYDIYGRRRKRPLSAKAYLSDTRNLSTSQMKLFFILLFFKTNSIQQQLAAEFEMDQSQVSRWIKILLPILHQAIKDCHCQAAQTMDELVRLFRQRQSPPHSNKKKETDSQVLNVDVTARPIGKNVDLKAQKKEYSKKHHGHRVKNTIICDEYQFIHFAGPTWLGSMHDKTIILEEIPHLIPLQTYQLWFSKDKGYQNYQPQGVHLLEPFRASRGNPLTPMQKRFNSWVNSIRVVVENAISGVKRLNLLAQPIRYYNHDVRNQFFQIGCGLHNLRVHFRRHNYSRGATRVRANLNF